MENTTFIGSDPTWANACVGENGYINYFTYAEGFSKAANLILDEILSSHGRNVDSFIYPICFNMRHSIELYLKGSIEEIAKLAEIKKVDLATFDLVGSHDIGNIWNYFKLESEKIDLRFKKINCYLDRTIKDIAAIDSTGQTFRYPFDIDKKRHLTERSIINCLVLKFKFNDLEKNLNKLKYLNDLLMDEYKQKTFIKRFSRSQIFNLVKELPQKKNWATDLNKDEIKSKYSLTGNELSKVLVFIQSNYETCALIGIKKELIAIPNELIIELCEIWANKFYPKFKELYTDSPSFDFYDPCDPENIKEAEEYFKNKREIYKDMEEKLTLDFVSDLWALYYLSRDNMKYSEQYVCGYEYFKKYLKRKKLISEAFNHVFEKTDFLEEIIKSLFFLQQIDIAEKIIKDNDLEKYFKFIPEARNRRIFEKWELLDYEI